MAKCKNCGKSGLFLITKEGFCNDCYEQYINYSLNFPNIIKQYEETINILNTTDNIETFFSRYDFLVNLIYKLVDMNKYIQTAETPKVYMTRLYEQTEEIINDIIIKNLKKYEEKLQSLKTTKSKETNFLKFVELLKTQADRYSEENKKTAVYACRRLQTYTNNNEIINEDTFKKSKSFNLIRTERKMREVMSEN